MSLREDLDHRLEEAVVRVPGVAKGRVRLDDDGAPHIYAIVTGERPSDEVLRDIQSLAITEFDVAVDQTAVSIVRLKSDDETPPAASQEDPIKVENEFEAASTEKTADEALSGRRSRPAIEKVHVARDGDTGWIRVTLRWPDGERTEGAAPSSERRPSRARGAADATLSALAARVRDKKLQFEIDGVLERTVGGRPSVLVHVFCEDHGKRLPLMGSAFVRDDVGTATVKAVLNAVDRVI